MEKVNLRDCLVGIAIGLKFRPNHAIEDNLGEIIDELLYQKESIFNYIVFPTTTPGIGQKVLQNPETGDSLTINRSNLILEINFSESIPAEKAESVINEFFKTVTEKIYKIVDIHEVYLIGVVNKYVIKNEEKVKAIMNLIENTSLTNINSINISFTKKIILSDSKLKKDIDDYENAIHSIVKLPEKKEVLFQVDYQRVFDPKLESIIDIKYKDFLDRVHDYNYSIINNWIDNLNA